jgi:hypothetical protein
MSRVKKATRDTQVAADEKEWQLRRGPSRASIWGPLSDLEPSGPRLDGRDNGTPQAKNGKENNQVEFEQRSD